MPLNVSYTIEEKQREGRIIKRKKAENATLIEVMVRVTGKKKAVMKHNSWLQGWIVYVDGSVIRALALI